MKRNKFSLSHYNLMSMNMGSLVPIACVDVLPGDTIQHATSALIRVSPLLAPVMHPVHVRIHHWFVPHRLVWDDWEDFITGGPDGNDASAFPYIEFATNTQGSLADYFGVPTHGSNLQVSALPFRSYNLIFNEYYRDQDLTTELVIDTSDGQDTTSNTTLQNCSWEKDYFTTARPWAQKGSDVTVPVSGDGGGFHFANATDSTERQVYTTNPAGVTIGSSPSATDTAIWGTNSTGLETTIQDMRLAFALQRYKEARAQYGSRYTEYLRYLGVKSSDARLQRPEYLGGGKQTIQFSEILQTGVDSTDQGVGNLKGHGITAIKSNRYRKFFEEHGYVITLMSVKPKAVYMDGMARHLNRRTKEDFFQKELQHIGQQEVLNKEVYWEADPAGSNTFGYQNRYEEYRRHHSGVHGEFRTSLLNYWHMARDFSSAQTLNSTFVQCNPTDRIYASTTADELYVMANHSMQARRMVSKNTNSFIF